jgi:hypothetical protein
MFCDGKVIGGYSFPNKTLGSVYELDGKISE